MRMIQLSRLAILLCILQTARGFSSTTTFSPLKSSAKVSSLRRFVFNPISDTETSATDLTNKQEAFKTPATVFGTPLDDETKERNKELVRNLKGILFDKIYAGKTIDRAYARFYALETIARMPYFSYLSVLHLYETIGQWRKAEYLKVHFSESWNELHHLLIMEELGGNNKWVDRFVAQHIAFFYYWIVVALYLFNPTFAYNLNQAVEEEAYETYDKFLTTNQDYLQQQPATPTAVEYYTGEDLYLWDAMHTDSDVKRRPACQTLYDTFVNVRDDELEHVKTMAHLQQEPLKQ